MKMISFHSMVRGSGKSALVVKAAKFLADQGHQVLLLDGYLYEIGGLHHNIAKIFGTWPTCEHGHNLYDIIEDYQTLHQAHLDPAAELAPQTLGLLNLPAVKSLHGRLMPEVIQRAVPVPTQERIHFLPGNHGDVLELLAPIDFDHLFDAQQGGQFFQFLKDEWSEHYDYVLCNANTGYDSFSGIICGQLADLLLAVDMDYNGGPVNPSYSACLRLACRATQAGFRPVPVKSIKTHDVNTVAQILAE